MRKLPLICCLFLWSCQSGPAESEPGTWQVVRESSGDVYYSALNFVDQYNGWAVGDSGTIINTSNSGYTWSYQQSGTTSDLRDVCFVNSRTGWAVGYNTVIHTTDGGSTWQAMAVVGDTSRTFTSVYFADELAGWTVHNHGEILHTEDGGVTWEVQASWERGGSALLSLVNEQVGYAKPVADTLLLKTTDGGQHWIPISNYRFRWETDMFFLDEHHGWVSNTKGPSSHWPDYANVFCTTDGGVTWTCLDTLTEVLHLNSIFFVDDRLGWVASPNKIYQTTDGGNTWDYQLVTEEEVIFQDIFFIDAEHGWVLGWRGAICKYTSP